MSRTSTITVSESYKYIGKERANAIIGFHAFTGTGMTGNMLVDQEACFRHFLFADFDILSALAKLCKSDRLPDETMISNLERYACVYFMVLRSTQNCNYVGFHIRTNKLKVNH